MRTKDATSLATTSAHTAGPWTVEDRTVDGLLRIETAIGTIAHVYGRSSISYANARLIEAAPDLLEACEFAIELLEHLHSIEFAKGGDKPARLKMIAAARKARGTAA